MGLTALAGMYAQGRVQGESFEIESFEDFTDHAESEDGCGDCKEALKAIRLSAKGAEDPEDVAERLYTESCRQVTAYVEKFWPQIEAVAAKLLEVGYLEGEEVRRIIEGVRR
jgi:hypothetical protein